MANVATVKLSWVKSPSQDIQHVRVVTAINGAETAVSVGPEVESITVDVAASSTVRFQVVVINADGLSASSETHTFALGSLENPLPATGLSHEIISIHDAAA